MAIELKVPSVGESVTSVEIGKWMKAEGDAVAKDEAVAVIDSEKATVEVPAPASGRLIRILKRQGESAAIGDVIGEIDEHAPVTVPPPPSRSGVPPPLTNAAAPANVPPPQQQQPTAPAPTATATSVAPRPDIAPPPPRQSAAPPAQTIGNDRAEEIVHMTVWRRAIARRLVEATQQTALLTTFNEVDMSAVVDLRKSWGEAFQKKHGVKLGFMSFFVKAAVDALHAFPQVNAEVRGDDMVFRNYCDVGIAVSSRHGLVVPIVRGADRLTFAGIELAIAEFAKRANENTLKPEDLEGGTFTITNGGVFGSMLSTPIVNPPQSAILGLHAIQDRPVVRDGQIVARPMMYVALTYDHRIIDGREAVLFLHRVKDGIETPARMLMDV
jgi:2-oxoglutarate dehydrogenase E2 component (dihydrolipoamide succinyltransferase)